MNHEVLPRDMVLNCARNFPASVAYIDGDRLSTWEDMAERAGRFAAVLQKSGIRKGDVVAILSKEHVEVIEHLFACFMIGAVRVGINTRYSQREILHVIRDSHAKFILIDVSCLSLIEEYIGELAAEGRQLMGYGGDHPLPLDYETSLRESDGEVEWPVLSGEDIAMITYTSGTTGLPKGVMLSCEGIRESLINTVMFTGLTHEDSFFNSTASAWVTVLLSTFNLANGMTVVLPNGDFDIHRFLYFVDKYRVTSAILVPVMLRRLVTACDEANYDLSTLRLIAYGSSPAPPALIKTLMNKFPHTKFVQLYGISETSGGWVTYLYHRDHVRGVNEKKGLLLSCGRPGLHMEVTIRDEKGNPVSRGETGEVWIRSKTNMLGYLNLPDLTRSTLEGGWLKTHDIGWMDDEGYLYLTDRKDFLIISGAVNVFPSVVENVISEHGAVREVAVVGAPHPEWGEAVVAMVSLHPGKEETPEQLIEFCKGKLAGFEVPKFIEIVDDLPKGVTGKILKKEIRSRYQAHPDLLPWNN